MKIEELVEKYVALRDKKAQIKAKYDAEVAKVDDVLDRVEAALLKHFDSVGVESVSTKAGTAYKSTRNSATVGDWDSFLHFVQQQEAWNFLERRVSKTAVEEFRSANDDLPPGVNYRSEVVVNIRRSK